MSETLGTESSKTTDKETGSLVSLRAYEMKTLATDE